MYFEAIVIHTFIAGIFGIPARLYIAGFLLSTESVRSPRVAVRLLYKYLLFSNYYMISFLSTSFLIKPFIGFFKNINANGETKGIIYLLICVPLAWFLYRVDFWSIVRADKKKISARQKLAIKNNQ